jgi:hypothetical protein
MPLRNFQIPNTDAGISDDIILFLLEAERRIQVFQEEHLVPGFVPSNFLAANAVFRALAGSSGLRGSLMCEWGSGMGVVTCLAAAAGFDATGIEIEPVLVEAARELAADFGIPANFVRGSFIPKGAEEQLEAMEESAWLTTRSDDAYDEAGFDPDEIDIVFAYPWPDEEAVTAELFERHAGIGAVLATFHGGDTIRLRRKVSRHGKR